MSITSETTVGELLASHVAAERPGATGIEARALESTVNGYSNENEVFVVNWQEDGRTGTESFVVRTQIEGRELFYETDLFFQWKMMEAVAKHSDIPVPRLELASPDPAVTGARLFVMEKVDGRVPPNRPGYHLGGWVAEDLTASQRELLTTNGLKELVKVHALDWRDGFDFLDVRSRGQGGLDQQVTYIEQWYPWAAKGRSFPVIEAGIAYLRDHMPTDAVDGVSWGDSRVGNMIFADDLSVAAVLDWEMAALGPCEMDLAWWLMFEEVFTRGYGIQALPGVPNAQETLDLYVALGGKPPGDLHYYKIMSWVRLIVSCIRIMIPEVADDVAMLGQLPYISFLADLLGVPCVICS